MTEDENLNINENVSDNIIDNNMDKNDNTVLSFILLSLIFVFQYCSKVNDVKLNMTLITEEKKAQIKLTDKIFWKYLVFSQISQFINFYFFYNSNSNILHFSNFIISFLLSFTYIIFFSKKMSSKSVLLNGMLLLFISLCHLIFNNKYSHILDVLKEISNTFKNVSFINLFMDEVNGKVNNNQIRNNLINNFIEKNALVTCFTKITAQFILTNINKTNFIKNHNNISFSFIIPIFLSLIIIFIYFYSEKNESNKNDSIKNLNDNKKIILTGIIECLFYSIYSLYKKNIFDYLKTKSNNINITSLSNTFITGFLVGITSFRLLYSYYNSNISNVAKINVLIMVIGIILIIFANDFNRNIYGALLIEASFGLNSVLFIRIKIYLLNFYLIEKRLKYLYFFEIFKNGCVLLINRIILDVNKVMIACLCLSIFCFGLIYFFFGNIVIDNFNGNILDDDKKTNGNTKKNKKTKK